MHACADCLTDARVHVGSKVQSCYRTCDYISIFRLQASQVIGIINNILTEDKKSSAVSLTVVSDPSDCLALTALPESTEVVRSTPEPEEGGNSDTSAECLTPTYEEIMQSIMVQ